MAVNKFSGARQLIIRNNATGDSYTFGPELVSSEGITIPGDPIEISISSYLADYVAPQDGVSMSAGTFNLIIPSVEILGKIWPSLWETASYDENAGRYHVGVGCVENDYALVWTRICSDDSTEDIYVPHAMISPATEISMTRDDPFTVQVSFYPQPYTDEDTGETRFYQIGSGLLTAKSRYDAESGEYKASGVSA